MEMNSATSSSIDKNNSLFFLGFQFPRKNRTEYYRIKRTYQNRMNLDYFVDKVHASREQKKNRHWNQRENVTSFFENEKVNVVSADERVNAVSDSEEIDILSINEQKNDCDVVLDDEREIAYVMNGDNDIKSEEKNEDELEKEEENKGLDHYDLNELKAIEGLISFKENEKVVMENYIEENNVIKENENVMMMIVNALETVNAFEDIKEKQQEHVLNNIRDIKKKGEKLSMKNIELYATAATAGNDKEENFYGDKKKESESDEVEEKRTIFGNMADPLNVDANVNVNVFSFDRNDTDDVNKYQSLNDHSNDRMKEESMIIMSYHNGGNDKNGEISNNDKFTAIASRNLCDEMINNAVIDEMNEGKSTIMNHVMSNVLMPINSMEKIQDENVTMANDMMNDTMMNDIVMNDTMMNEIKEIKETKETKAMKMAKRKRNDSGRFMSQEMIHANHLNVDLDVDLDEDLYSKLTVKKSKVDFDSIHFGNGIIYDLRGEDNAEGDDNGVNKNFFSVTCVTTLLELSPSATNDHICLSSIKKGKRKARNGRKGEAWYGLLH